MDIVTINCPNCGGAIQRKKNEYFVRCPYCGSETAFDEIKEEVQLTEYRERLDGLEQDANTDRVNREAMIKWCRWRNIFLIAMTLFQLLGFLAVGYVNATENEGLLGIGSLSVLAALMIYLGGMPALASHYPAYNALVKTTEKGGKVIMWLKLLAIGFGLLFAGAFGAYLILSVFMGI